jgi:hypothetical protein
MKHYDILIHAAAALDVDIPALQAQAATGRMNAEAAQVIKRMYYSSAMLHLQALEQYFGIPVSFSRKAFTFVENIHNGPRNTIQRHP